MRMMLLAVVLLAGGFASIGSEFPQVTTPMLTAGAVCAVLALVFSGRRARR